MRIKRFEAADTRTALAMVKKELGENAIILASRTIRPAEGRTGTGRVEVVAAMDYDLEGLAPENAAPPAASEAAALRNGELADPSGEILPLGRLIRPVKAGWPVITSRIGSGQTPSRQQLAEKLPAGSSNTRRTAEPPALSRRLDRPREEAVRKWREQLIKQLRFTGTLRPPIQQQPLILALVWATGVGKTTTAAKLAAWFALREKCSVALLSMDCYRIGATDQLRTYARIMHLPCDIALRKSELQQAIHRHRQMEIIIIDTAGKSPFDERHIGELREWFAGERKISPHLVLSATTKKEDMARILETYAPLAPESLILTKLDETRAYASVCQQVVASSLPLSYLCTGQRVPEDFLAASREFLAKLFTQGWQAVGPELRAAASPENWLEHRHGTPS
jgi:flagellar biosynthesis protein FlhF